MDHVIKFIIDYMQPEVENFREEWESGAYKKISDCPTYDTVKAYCNAIRELNKMDGRFPDYTPASILEME